VKRYIKVFLIGVILLAAILRFWQLGINPPSLTWDEVAWGYNAYSIGIDGKDEFGRFLPHDYLESFGDFKPPVYAYVDVLPVKIFGLTEFATRFPSAFFGVLTVFITYFLVKQLFATAPKKEWYGLMASFVLAVSPWHIMLSRAAFEANVATFFLTTGVWLFLLSIQQKKWYLLLSAVCFVLSLYTFNTSRIVAPLLVIALAIGFYKPLLKIKTQVIIAAIIGFLVLLPTLGFLFSANASLRFKEVNIFSNLDIVTASNDQIAQDNNSIIAKFLHNRRFGYTHEYLKHYFDNLSLNFLFLEGDGNPKFSIQSVGQLYIWDIIFFFLGMLYLFKRKEGSGWILPIWILLGIIPAATARETPHALRIETTLPAFQIFVAYGFVNFVSDLKKKIYGVNIQYIVAAVSFLLLFLNITYFLHDYYNHYPKRFSAEWQYGYKEAITYVARIEKSYDAVYFSEDMGRPYIYFLFYNKFNPVVFRNDAVVERDIFGFVHVAQIGKYHFVTGFPQDKGKKNLYVAYVNKIEDYNAKVPKGANVLKVINRLNGKIVLVVYTL
jgi:4-amino-4-deoxy-L-arabinose transferase-like glycosyltransferase